VDILTLADVLLVLDGDGRPLVLLSVSELLELDFIFKDESAEFPAFYNNFVFLGARGVLKLLKRFFKTMGVGLLLSHRVHEINVSGQLFKLLARVETFLESFEQQIVLLHQLCGVHVFLNAFIKYTILTASIRQDLTVKGVVA